MSYSDDSFENSVSLSKDQFDKSIFSDKKIYLAK